MLHAKRLDSSPDSHLALSLFCTKAGQSCLKLFFSPKWCVFKWRWTQVFIVLQGCLRSLEEVVTVEVGANRRGHEACRWEAGWPGISTTCHNLSCGCPISVLDGGYGCIRARFFRYKAGLPGLGRSAWLWLSLVVRSTASSCRCLWFPLDGGSKPEVMWSHCMWGHWSKEEQDFRPYDASPSRSLARIRLAYISLHVGEDWSTWATMQGWLGRPVGLGFLPNRPKFVQYVPKFKYIPNLVELISLNQFSFM
jgi:hypothetical protein